MALLAPRLGTVTLAPAIDATTGFARARWPERSPAAAAPDDASAPPVVTALAAAALCDVVRPSSPGAVTGARNDTSLFGHKKTIIKKKSSVHSSRA